MSQLSEAILPLVPYLRRHARLLTGSTEVGDEYVRLCLELIVTEPDRIPGDDLPAELFAAFHAAWAAVHAPPPSPATAPSSEEDRLEHGIAALAPLERQVLLLSVVEGLSDDQICRVLKLNPEEVERARATAKAELTRSTTLSVLIIEDEPVVALELSQIVQDMGMTVLAAVAEQQDAIASAAKKPSLVLADVQLQGNGSGIAAAREILQSYDVPIVFVTGFPERLLTGEGLEPAFVVAKPFTEVALKATIAHALDIYNMPENAAQHRERLLAKLSQITARELRDRVSRAR